MELNEVRKKEITHKGKPCIVKLTKSSETIVYVVVACAKPRRIARSTCKDTPSSIKRVATDLLNRVVVW